MKKNGSVFSVALMVAVVSLLFGLICGAVRDFAFVFSALAISGAGYCFVFLIPVLVLWCCFDRSGKEWPSFLKILIGLGALWALAVIGLALVV